MALAYIIWHPNEVLFQIGFLKIRWYSLMIICAFLSAQRLVSYFFKKEGRPVEDVDPFSFYVLLVSLIGARVGEVLFYSPMYYLKHPLEAILPIKLTPHFQVIGYRGLSYHGAVIGGIVGTLLYLYYNINFRLYPLRFQVIKQREKNQSLLWLSTPLAFGLLMGLYVRIGNFINSEIIGTPTHKSYGVLFAKDAIDDLSKSSRAIKSVEILKDSTAQPDAMQGYPPVILKYTFSSTGVEEENIKRFIENKLTNYLQAKCQVKEHIYAPAGSPLAYTITKNKKGQYVASVKAFGVPRHPVQLYESFSYLLTFIVLFAWWKRKRATLRDGVLAGLTLIISYGFRFFFEFFKDPFNVLIPGKYPFTMGHMLSLLTVLGGVIVLIYAYRGPHVEKLNK